MKLKITINADGNVNGVVRGINNDLNTFKSQTKTATEHTDKLGASVKRVGHYAAAAFGIYQVSGLVADTIRAGDSFAALEGQIKLVTESTAELAYVQGELNRVSFETRADITRMTKLYSALSPTFKEMGKSTVESTRLVELYNKSLALTSPTAIESASATLQFAQAMGSGVLRGEEFNSIMENGRGVAMMLAEGLNVPIGSLRAMAEQGELTADVVVSAFERQANTIEEKFKNIPLTVSGAWQNVRTQTMLYVGETDQAIGATNALANSLNWVAENIDTFGYAVATHVRDASDAFEALQYKVGLVYAILNTEISLNTFADIENLVDSYNDSIEKLYKNNEKFKSSFLSSFDERKRAYELETQYQRDLIELGFESHEVSARSIKLTSENTEAKKEQAEQEKAWNEAVKQFHQEYRDELAADAAAAELYRQNTIDAQYDQDIAQFDDWNKADALLQDSINIVNEYGDAWTRTGNAALDALGSMTNALATVNANDKEYIEKMSAARTAKFEDEADRIKTIENLEAARAQNSIKGSMEMLAASVSMYEEGSDAQRAAHTAYLAMSAIELATNLQKAISAATVSVATQGQGDPYTAFARVAAMAALMGGVLSQIGANFSYNGGSAPSDVANRQSYDDGSVLGGGVTDAIANTYTLLTDIEADQYTELRAINAEMQALNANITGVVSASYASGDFTNLASVSSYDLSEVEDVLKSYSNLYGSTGIPVIETLTNLTSGALSGIATGLGFGGTSKTRSDYGYSFSGTLGDADIDGYETIRYSKDGGWFNKSKTWYKDQQIAIASETEQAFALVFDNIASSTIELGDLLERDVTDQVNSFAIDIGNISATGSAEEFTAALNQALSAQTDQLANEIFSDIISAYQMVGESAFDTLSRVAIEKVVVSDILAQTNQIAVDSIAVSQALVGIAGGLDELQSAAANYYDAFFTDAEKATRNQEQLTAALAEQNLALPDTRDGYRDLVESLNLGTESAQEQYVALLELADLADDYYDNLESQATELAETQAAEFEAYKNDLLNERIDLLNEEASAVSNSISALEQLYNSLESTYDSIIGSVTADAVTYTNAQAQIANALTQAQNGNLPTLDSISSALSIVTRNDASNYASYADYQRDQLLTAGMVDELMGYTADQMSVEQQMLSALEQSVASLNEIADNTSITSAVQLNYLLAELDGSHADGLSYVPFDGYRSELHRGEAVFDAPFMSSLRKYGIPANTGSNTALISEIKQLRAEVSQLRQDQKSGFIAVAKNTKSTAKTLNNFDVIGMPSERTQ